VLLGVLVSSSAAAVPCLAVGPAELEPDPWLLAWPWPGPEGLAVTGLCLSLGAVTRPDPDVWAHFLG